MQVPVVVFPATRQWSFRPEAFWCYGIFGVWGFGLWFRGIQIAMLELRV